MTACTSVAVAAVLGIHRCGWEIGVGRAMSLSYSGRPGLRRLATGRERFQTGLNFGPVGRDWFPSGPEIEPEFQSIERTAVEQGQEACRAYRMG